MGETNTDDKNLEIIVMTSQHLYKILKPYIFYSVNQLLLTSSSTTQLQSLLIKVGPAQARRKQLGSTVWEWKEAELEKNVKPSRLWSLC